MFSPLPYVRPIRYDPDDRSTPISQEGRSLRQKQYASRFAQSDIISKRYFLDYASTINSRTYGCQDAVTPGGIRYILKQIGCNDTGRYRNSRCKVSRYEGTEELLGLISGVCNLYNYAIFDGELDDLYSYSLRRRGVVEIDARSVFRRIVEIALFFHERGVVFIDYTLSHFVFRENERPRDARVIYADNGFDGDIAAVPAKSCHGHPSYLSPERLRVLTNDFESYAGRADNVWSAGVMLYHMLVGYFPFAGSTYEEVVVSINGGGWHKDDENAMRNLSPMAYNLIERLLDRDPSSRISFDEAAEHPWLAVVDESSQV